MKILQANRTSALNRLKSFVPRMGRRYESTRNYDLGPEDRSNTSLLSPFVSHRLLLEEEVVGACLSEHSPEDAQKFIQEVCWRTYWKGWLEQRPAVWDEYSHSLSALKESHVYDAKLNKALAAKTGIDCFDFWVKELTETGYLHNHARMWFASIWIFTLQLPWQLGAEFFLCRLLDGDAASNTLGWRWVAGLQTAGKHYLARTDNIVKYTKGRFAATGLQSTAEPIGEVKRWPTQIPDMDRRYSPGKKTAFLIFEQDLSLKDIAIAKEDLELIALLDPSNADNWSVLSEQVRNFKITAVNDTVTRCKREFPYAHIPTVPVQSATALLSLLEQKNIEQLVYSAPFVGPWRSFFLHLQESLPSNVTSIGMYRDWDRFFFPRATKGFFQFRKSIPEALERFDLER